MNRMYHALRTWFRGSRQCTRTLSPLQRPSLTIELLEDRVLPATTDWQSVIGLNAAQLAYPYKGTGYTVAVLDTGIDYNHPDLGGGFGAGHRVIAGYDFVNNDADPMDDNGHGTHLAGIIGSSNANSPGEDPNVNFVALKVLDANNNGSWTAIDNALQWVIAHQAQYNIVAVNISLGSGNYTVNPYNFLEADFSALKNLGVFTAAAAGNRFFTFNSQPGIGYPSISPNVVSVGATWAGDFGSATFSTGATDYTTAVDRVAAFGQRSSNLDIMAPGAWITSTAPGGGYRVMGGTSQATAVVTGAAVLIHEALDKAGKSSLATQDNILKIMQSTGVTVIDGDDENDNVVNTGLSFKRLDIKAALDTIGQPNTAPTFNTIPNQTLTVGQTITVPLVANDPEKDPITFTYRLVYLPAQAYQLDQQYGLTSNGNYYTNGNGANEKWIYGSNSTWYWLMPNGDLRRYAGSTSATLQSANLLATLDASYYANPAKLWNAPYAGNPPIVFSLNGNMLSIRSSASWVGTFAVEVTASDGRYSVKQSFNVTEVAANTPPALTAIANQTMAHSQDKLTLALAATDAENDPITYSAQVLSSNGQTPAVGVSLQGNQLTLDPAASFVGTFTVQANASDGKATSSRTFTVTVNNAAPVLAAIADQSLSHGKDAVIALSASDADGDALAYSVQAPAGIAASVQGNQLTLKSQQVVGTFAITVTVGDGAATASRTFNVTFTNAGPTLSDLPAQTMAKGQTSLTLGLALADADGDKLTVQASAQTPSAALYQLKQQYGLQQYGGSYFTNLWGYGEKWLIGNNNLWYVLLPNGKLQRWAQSMTETLKPANYVATVDASVFAEPRLLWDAKPAVAPALTFTVVGNQLTIQRPASLTGIFFIDVTVSDGWTTVKRTLQVTLN